MAKIFISTTSFDSENSGHLEYCRKGNEVITNPFGRKLTSAELLDLAADSKGIIAGTETYDKSVFQKLPKLKVISRCGAGLDSIDLETAKQLGIKVFNTPDAPTMAVAELTIGLIFCLLRRIPEMDMSVRDGKWKKPMGSLLNGKKVGIVGLGRIGKKVAELIGSFGVEIICYDLKPDSVFINNYKIKKTSLKDLLISSDIVTLHIPSQPNKKYLISKDEFAVMKKSSYLINTSRGDILDETALADALKNNIIGGAAIDVFEKEPYAGPLKELKNVILTPHVGSYAKEARIRMEKEAVDNLIKGLNF